MSLWVGVAVAVVSCQNIDSEATKTVYFFDLKTYFETEIKRLESKNIKVNKKATLETGLEIDVPLFIEVGNKIKIDTKTGAYMERVK